MKTYKIFTILGMAAAMGGFSSCTDLDETVYDQITGQNFYNSADDVIHGVFRPFEHMYYTMWQVHEHEELTGDQLCTTYRHDWWVDQQKWVRYHRHQYDEITFNDYSRGEWTSEWTLDYQGISQCNFMLDELDRLSPEQFRISQTEWDGFRGQLRCLRAYAYQRLLNCYRHCVLSTTSDAAANETPEAQTQVAPEVMFSFIEKELLDCLVDLPAKPGNGGNGTLQGQFTKAAAAALLVRHYLNAKVWIGQEKWDACITMADRILSGEFGPYAVADRWDEAFDWNNRNSDEVIFAFPSSRGTSNWIITNQRQTIHGRCLPYDCHHYLGISQEGQRNPRYCIVPSYDNAQPRQVFSFKLGNVSQKFLKYANISPDARWKQYKNTSDNTREGMMFLEGYIINPNSPTGHGRADQGYDIYLRDQVGMFQGGAPTGTITNPSMAESRLENGDFNSGLFVVKYPYYPYDGNAYMESDFTLLRLPEVIYSKAECLLRKGDATGAGALLNGVRKRNYQERGFLPSIAYQGSDGGLVKLDLDEMLDEWGREFLAESRRRTDLIRFGRFQDAWWDKPQDADKHYELFPLSQAQMEQNLYLVQNPGYPTIR